MEEAPAKPSVDRLTLALRWVLGVVAALIILGVAAITYAYFITSAALRYPTNAHYHFRMQVIVDGQAVNFGDAKYQTEFNKDICSAKLTKAPFHFHDNLDQFAHVHWGNLTGGLLLKNYGWNLIGGANNTLGYRFDQLPKVSRIPVHGRNLPAVPSGAKYYIYTGDQNGYRQADWSKFLRQDLKTFFSQKSISARSTLLDHFVPTASAHGGAADGDADSSAHSEEELIQINHVLGNVVIFAQANAPTDSQIKARFLDLIPLPQSACGG